MERLQNPDITSTASFYIQQPHLRDLGFNLFYEWAMSDGLISLPAFTGIRVNYLCKGFSYYNNTLKAGDIVIAGFTSQPMYGYVKDFSMYSIGIHFSLFYKLTGMPPMVCRKPIILSSHDPVYHIFHKFFEMPVSCRMQTNGTC